MVKSPSQPRMPVWRNASEPDGAGLVASLVRLGSLVARAFYEEFLREIPESNFRPSFKRLLVLFSLATVLPLLTIWAHLGLALDDWIVPEHADEEVDRPVFIVSNARSGSTKTHRDMLAGDSVFVSPSVFQILFAPAVTQKLLFHYLGNLDVLRVAARLDAALFEWTRRHWLHPVSLLSPEEDEWYMFHLGYSQLLLLFFPNISPEEPLARVIRYQESLWPEERRALMAHYASLLKRHLHFVRRTTSGARHRYLSKNPTFTLRIPSLIERFPTAEFVVLVRDPHRSVPSMVSYITKWWNAAATPRFPGYPSAEALQGMCAMHYEMPIQWAKAYPGTKFTFVKYEEEAGLDEGGAEHECSVRETLGLTTEEFEQKHAKIFEAYPEYSRVS